MFLRKKEFTPGILFDVIMFNMWVRTEKKEANFICIKNEWKFSSAYSMDAKLAAVCTRTP
jgi:hypothetical protein